MIIITVYAFILLFFSRKSSLKLYLSRYFQNLSEVDEDVFSFYNRNIEKEIFMFRKMRRFRQQISDEECVKILKEQPRGVLSMMGDDGYPYGIPMDHWYCEDDGHLYFHCAKEGHKLDAIRANDKVGYCVFDQGYRKDGEWALNINSVVIFGRIHEVTDEDKKRAICTNLAKKFTDDNEYLQHELEYAFPRVNCLELVPEHMTGKLVNES